MIEDDQLRTARRWHGLSRWNWTFLLLTGLLSSTILLKIGAVQYLELLDAFQLFLLLALFAKHDFKGRLLRTSLTIGILYLVFLIAAFVLALAALRSQFFYPPTLTFLKRPVWITISRSVELVIDAGIMIYLIQRFRGDRKALAFTMKVYWWAGVASAVYSIVSYPLSVLHIGEWGTYSIYNRMRGFFNEGGPYGLYLLSVILLGVALYKMKWVKRSYLRAGLVLALIAFVGSQSKAAVMGLIALLAVNTLMVRSVKTRLAIFSLLILGGVILSMSVNLPEQLRIYRRNADAYERLSNFRDEDPNFVLGRLAGAFIVPRMIEAHPLTGIGWGNYGLLRDNPLYRGASAWVGNGEDLPSLGLLGEAAELGVPLTLFLLVCLSFPYFYLRHIGAPLYIRNLALLQPLIHACGGQLNLTYPWVVTAFALGLGYLEVRSVQRSQVAPALVLDRSAGGS